MKRFLRSAGLMILLFVSLTDWVGEGNSVSAAGPSEEDNPPPISAIREPTSAGCLADPAAIEDLRKRNEEILVRSRALDSKEAELQARQRALDEELKKLEELRKEISKIDESKRKEMEERVTKLVETLESMSPKAAAKVLSEVDENLAVTAMSRISTPRLAKIMNSMEIGRSARLSELLAGAVRANEATSKVGTATQSAKGGERDDGHIKQSASNIALGDSSGGVSTGEKAGETRRP